MMQRQQRRIGASVIRWQVPVKSLVPWSLIVLMLVASLGEAIVKQPRSDDSQQASSYQNHQANLGSSVSSSSSSSPSGQQSNSVPSSSSSSSSQSSVANTQPSGQNVYSASLSSQGQASQQQPQQYSSSSSYGSASPKSSYADQLAASPDQSYQAAAQSVNMALANSGIFGSAQQQQQPNYASQQQASIGPVSSNNQQVSPQQQSGQQASLNPLHYFYYPSKDSQKLDQGNGGYQPQSASSSSSTNNQMNSYASYADQLSSALSQMGGPDVAASSQDPSYLPQPSNLNANNQGPVDMSGQPMVGNSNMNGPNNQQPFNGDLATSYGPGQQQPNGGSISFGSSSSSNMNQPQQPQQDSPPYLNSHHLTHQTSASIQNQQPQQQVQQLSNQNTGYNPNSYSSLSDITNSAYGGQNSYLASQGQHSQMSGMGAASQHDLFSSLSSQFNSGAASQLSPAQVPPPQQQQPSSSSPSSSLNVASNQNSLFGPQTNLFSSQSQAPANSLFASQPYLSSFLTPQQYSQLAGASGLTLDQAMSSSSPVGSAAVAPAATTSAAVSTGSSSKRFGISSFIMPMLALAGLSLLIPTMSNIGTAVGKRKKRSISSRQEISYEPMNGSGQVLKEASIGEYMDKIERYYSIYKSAVESDDCLNRLICEFGDAVKDMTGKSAVVTVIEKLVPNWMTGKVHLFKEAALDNKEGKEKCKKYVCQSNKRQH